MSLNTYHWLIKQNLENATKAVESRDYKKIINLSIEREILFMDISKTYSWYSLTQEGHEINQMIKGSRALERLVLG